MVELQAVRLPRGQFLDVCRLALLSEVEDLDGGLALSRSRKGIAIFGECNGPDRGFHVVGSSLLARDGVEDLNITVGVAGGKEVAIRVERACRQCYTGTAVLAINVL